MLIRQLVCTDNFAGVERYVATASVELAGRGHDVEVYGGDPGAMAGAFAGSPVRFVAAPDAGAALSKSLRGSRPDLVHSHMTAGDAVAVVSRPFHRAPVVSTLHFAQPRGHDPVTRTVYSLIPRLVTTQIAISAFVGRRAGGNPTVIHSGVPDPAPDGPPGPSTRAPVVLVAQRLESEKATTVALDAFAQSAVAEQGWELHVAGAGSERPDLERRADALGIGHVTSFLGRVDDLAVRMAGAGMLLAPTPVEAFGLSVVEAMASGLPVVAAGAGGHRETVGSATPESLFPPGDADVAATLLRTYASDPAARADLAARGRRRYEEAFTIEAHVDALETVYGNLAARRR